MPDIPFIDPAQPLFAQVRDALRAQIYSGALPAGSKLPTEGMLEKTFGVSRVTIRQALSELQVAGLIDKVNGKGSFVRRPRPLHGLGPLAGFYETMRRRGHEAVGKVGAVRVLKAEVQVAASLGIATGAPVSAVTVKRIVDGKPYAQHTLYASAGLMQTLLAQDLEANDLLTVLHDRLGYRLQHSKMEISAIVADARLARNLAVTPGSPILQLCVSNVGADNVPMVFSEFLISGELFRFQLKVDH